MSINVPGMHPLLPLSRISPSRYFDLRACALKEIWASNRQPVLLPASPSARLGTIAHKLIGLAFSGELADEYAMRDCWEREVRNQEKEMSISLLEKHMIPLSHSTRNYWVKQVMTYNIARPFLGVSNKFTTGVTKPATEVWVQTEDGKIGGKIDLVEHSDKGISIIDYKTGVITESNQNGASVKGRYQYQLKIYAALYYLSHKIWPIELVLIGLDQAEHRISVDQKECLSLIDSAIHELDTLNDNIKSGLAEETFATPAAEICAFCGYRPACRSYWERKENQDAWPVDLEGTVLKKRLLANRSLIVELGCNDASICVRGLSPDRYTFLQDDCRTIMLCNLGRDAVERHFKETLLTTGYRIS